MPFFSVIIPTFNRETRIEKTIDSVIDQKFKDFELIVVDDGSTDNTKEILEKYTNKIKYVYQKNQGVSAARNRGISQALGEYIAFLDDDDIWDKNKLLKHFKFIENNPDIQIHQSDETWIRNNKHLNKKKIHKKISGDIFIKSLNLCLVSPSAVVIHKNIFEKYGIFDTDLLACEDYDLWLRISLFEQIGLIDEELLIKYGGHEDQLSSKYWGMDRFRIYSLLKVLKNNNFENSEQKEIALKEILLSKIDVLIIGSEKRGKKEYLTKLKNLKTKINDETYNKKEYQFLLE